MSLQVLYARNEHQGIKLRCPHCTFTSRHDSDDVGDAIKEHKAIVCVACDKEFYVEIALPDPRGLTLREPVAPIREKAFVCRYHELNRATGWSYCHDCGEPFHS